MNFVLAVSLIAIFIYNIATDTTDEEIRQYIKQHRGTFIEKENVSSFFFSSRSSPTYYIITYSDRNGKIHKVSAKTTNNFSKRSLVFYDDIITGKVPPMQKTAEDEPEAEEKFKWQIYKCNGYEIRVLQEFHNPNRGEKVHINYRPAPDGKYKLGLLRHIHVRDGRIFRLTSF